jgi:hypothetical protein
MTCGQHHLYVIELKKSVWEKETKFRNKNKHLPSNYEGKCYYVGQTKHHPECRYKQHAASKARRNNPRAGFLCNCFSEATVKRLFNKRRSATYVGDYHKKGGLRPSVYGALNPIATTLEDAQLAEAALAQQLRDQGFAVHSA